MRNKITFERCYICDWQSETPSGYVDGLVDPIFGGRVVYIQKDGKPVCTACRAIAIESLKGFDTPEWMADNLAWLFDKTPDLDFVPLVMEGDEIDWDRVEYSTDGSAQFPLPKRLCCCKGVDHLTIGERAQVDEIRAKKGYVESPEELESKRVKLNKELDNHVRPLPHKPRLAPLSNWPLYK